MTMPLLAHSGAPVSPHDLWAAWSFTPSLVVPLAVTAFLYAHAVRRLWQGGGRGAGVSERQTVSFSTGMLVLVVALVSPLDALGEALFAAHMVQHLLLTVVAAPLLLAGRVHLVLVPLLPLRWRRRGARWLSRARHRAGTLATAGAVAVHVLVVIAWHLPGLYDLAVRQEAIHVTEHLTLLASGLLFWVAMGVTRPRPVAVAGLAAFVTSLAFILLAALLTTAPAPWYESHVVSAPAWGLSPLQDQQLAAAIMWVPGGLVYLGAAASTLFRWIREDEHRAAARQVAQRLR